ncbi:ATP-grasp domain-containing protein [Leifsonia sp. Leaf336]|uniref:ATP-grasp domain-containing protein n=1 Tax=Leifsonia sp. Leaf336 TaxID=1736341 RepID=UPI00138F9ABC|nr:ATP-grasp domain-containing protein [Leifsonia sp. Leaf336]
MEREVPTWVIEGSVFRDNDVDLADAVWRTGGCVVAWRDEWSTGQAVPALTGPVVFHGSLGSADVVARAGWWSPGAFCATSQFACSAWWPAARDVLLTSRYTLTTVGDLVAAGAPDGFGARIFVRPDSPLKPFSGRVLDADRITLQALDHGFYYDETSLPVIVTPVVEVREEWRLVVVGDRIVAGSSYTADGRRAGEPLRADHRVCVYGQSLLKKLPTPDLAFVMDIAEGPDGLRLLELNPFSGADLYACDRDSIVSSLHQALLHL